MKRSGSTNGRTFRPWSSRPALARYCSTWAAKPPTEPSSTVISTSCSRAGLRRAVGTDQAGTVDGEAYRQALDGHVVHHLIVGALQEGRVDRGERLEAFRGKPRREGHAMLLGDADVEATLRKALGELVEA